MFVIPRESRLPQWSMNNHVRENLEIPFDGDLFTELLDWVEWYRTQPHCLDIRAATINVNVGSSAYHVLAEIIINDHWHFDVLNLNGTWSVIHDSRPDERVWRGVRGDSPDRCDNYEHFIPRRLPCS